MEEDKHLETNDSLVLQESDLEKLDGESELSDLELKYEPTSKGV